MKYLVIALALFSSLANAEVVKQSKSGICHDASSSYYSRTKIFTSFDTLEGCLAAGGKLPKGHSSAAKNKTEVGYSRDKFGHGWDDADRDCQNTRQEVLISMSTNPVRFADEKQCRVTFGRWISTYSGEVIFDASTMDIDHVVPLKWAWDHGADKWSQEKREQFANDPVNLVAVEASLNRSKGAKGLDEWLPPANQEQYKARFKRILLKYGFSGI
ncbi:HNH endonuclease family protein [Marinomonas gallaica]|uniref:HNH endonuclease family protein n=1 Tax=Marinomonas gallaica TaxID=1806667 RepID=UPI003CE525E5